MAINTREAEPNLELELLIREVERETRRRRLRRIALAVCIAVTAFSVWLVAGALAGLPPFARGPSSQGIPDGSRGHASVNATLSSTTNVDFGSCTQAVVQAPDNVVYCADGRTVDAVRGGTRPAHLVTMPRSVWALAATDASLFVETSRSVSRVSLPSGAIVGTWPLPVAIRRESPSGPVIGISFWDQTGGGGLSLEGGSLWAWGDVEYCDICGSQAGSLARYNLTTMQPKVVDVGDLWLLSYGTGSSASTATGSLGYYYVDRWDRIVRADAGERLTRSAPVPGVDAFAIEGRSLYLAANIDQGSGPPYLFRYNARTLKLESSVPLADEIESLISTRYGLMAVVNPEAWRLDDPANSYAIALIHPATGAEKIELHLNNYSGENSLNLISGSHLSALITRGNEVYLDRLDVRVGTSRD